VITVGITQRSLPPTEFGEFRFGLDHRWFPFLAACGVTTVPLPNLAGLALDTARKLDLEGLVFSGGETLSAYGGPSPARDETEAVLLRWALGNRVPVLGVCRGAQVLLDAFGTTLVPVAGHVSQRHEVVGESGTRTVNSYHHYAARTVAEPLRATAVAGDVVEGFRHREAAVLGVMWHPEREEPFDAADVRLVGDLFGGAR
jgi:putative glutamine amidotransferase